MIFNIWKIGLYIQQHEALAVAIVHEASGWYLQRWWCIPPTPQAIVDGHIRKPEQLVSTLLSQNREFPRRHHTHLFPPANRMPQKKFPCPTVTPYEPEQTAWLSGSMVREFDMVPNALHFDYSEGTLGPAFNVTAVQSKEISVLLTLIRTLEVQVTAITSDASALQQFIPLLPGHRQYLVWRDDAQWLRVTHSARGRKSASDIDSINGPATTLSPSTITIAQYSPGGFDPLSTVSICQPPIPTQSHHFAIALGLTMGGAYR